MAILSRVKISPQQRFDLEDFTAGQASARSDSKLFTQKFLSESNLILNNFSLSGLGLNQATVSMANSALIIPESTFDLSYFISSPTESDIVISDADLIDNARNYIEIELCTEDNTPLTKAFWDPDANSGSGAEFNQIVNTITDLKVNFVVLAGGFSGLADRLPVAIIDTDGTGAIKLILDRREMYGRLALPTDLDNEYNWGTKEEPPYTMVMTSVVGVFTVGEEVTIGSETATVVSVGGSTIAFKEPSGISFASGDSVTGGTSGATGTVNTISEAFTGVDKSLKNQKLINDALMTEIKNIKGTRFWWDSSASLSGSKQEFLSSVVALTAGARFGWDGTSLKITDNSLVPTSADALVAIRLFHSTSDLQLTRQDDGKEVVKIALDLIADAGVLTLDQDGNSIAINWDDETSDIQTTWDANASVAATISGSPAGRNITITFDAAGDQVDVFVDSTTLLVGGNPVVETLTIKQGLASDESIALLDGQVLYIDLADPLASTDYSDVGAGAANYKVGDRGTLSLLDAPYWLAYREGSKLYLKGLGELEAGEERQVNDETPVALSTFLGFDPETAVTVPYDTLPDLQYVSQTFTDTDSLVRAISVNTANINQLGATLNENVYSEPMTVVVGVPADDNEIQGPVVATTAILIPLDSRNSDIQEEYIVGAGVLKVYLNGQLLYEGSDYNELGSVGTLSSQIEISQDLAIGDRLLFRIDTRGGYQVISGSGTGDINNGTNVGGAAEVFKDKVGDTLRFRSIEAGNSIEVTENLNTISIALKLATRTVTIDDSALTSDDLILVDAASGAVIITLPTVASSDGKRLYIKKIDATANTVTLDGNGAELIDGLATQQTTVQYESFTIICDGLAWYIV